MLSYTNFDMPGKDEGFEKRGGWVVNHLMIDLNPIQLIHSGAIVGNLGGESGLQAINEKRPIIPGSRGGWSWAQWTGDRRNQFEKFCNDNNFSFDSDQAAYEFLVWELLNSEKHSLEQLRKTSNLEAAVYTFCVLFERPSDPQGGLKDRIHFAQRALAGASELKPPPGPTTKDEEEKEITKDLNQQELERVKKEYGDLIGNQEKVSQIPPARTAPGVALAVGGGFTSTFASTIQYLGPWNWPLPRPDDVQALAISGFLLTGGATIFHLWANRKKGN